MEYWSRLGTICYYDIVDREPKICEPTMLFMLGLEATLTPSNEYIMLVPVIDPNTKEQAIDPITGEPIFEEKPNIERLKALVIHRNEIGEEQFNKAYFYLYDKYPKDDVTEINCTFRNLKASLNYITGTESNRTMPIIYHAHFRRPEISDYDAEAKKLLDILNCAGYKVKDNSVPYRGKFDLTDDNDIALIDEYNSALKEAHEKKKLYSQIYKIMDYKAMYVYALGVLYGCLCQGCSPNLVFRTDPSSWYDGEYTNLIKTAFEVFRFHYTHHICDIDVDPHLFRKYKGIQTNKIWDFSETNIEIRSDETACTVLSIEDGEIKEAQVFYSKSTNSYLIPEENEWKSIDEFVLSSDPKIGIISNEDPIITRYIANDEVSLIKSFKYGKDKFLSPNNDELYFIYTNNIGWSHFDENSYKVNSPENCTLTLTPRGFDSILQYNIGLAVNKSTNDIVAYYRCYLNGNTKLLGRRSLFGVTSDFTISYTNEDLFFTDWFNVIGEDTLVGTLPDGMPFTLSFYNSHTREDIQINIKDETLFDSVMSEETFMNEYSVVYEAGVFPDEEDEEEKS